MSTTLFAPFSRAYLMLGSAASMRCVLEITPFLRGTLKSTRMMTRLSTREPILSIARRGVVMAEDMARMEATVGMQQALRGR